MVAVRDKTENILVSLTRPKHHGKTREYSNWYCIFVFVEELLAHENPLPDGPHLDPAHCRAVPDRDDHRLRHVRRYGVQIDRLLADVRQSEGVHESTLSSDG